VGRFQIQNAQSFEQRRLAALPKNPWCCIEQLMQQAIVGITNWQVVDREKTIK